MSRHLLMVLERRPQVDGSELVHLACSCGEVNVWQKVWPESAHERAEAAGDALERRDREE